MDGVGESRFDLDIYIFEIIYRYPFRYICFVSFNTFTLRLDFVCTTILFCVILLFSLEAISPEGS